MKFLIAFMLICVSAVVVNAGLTIIPENVDIFGEIEDYDVILGDSRLEKSADDEGAVESFLTFTAKNADGKHFLIHAIKHYDFHTMPYSQVTIVDGGIDHDHVTLKVRSQLGQSIKSLFRFFGEYTDKKVCDY